MKFLDENGKYKSIWHRLADYGLAICFCLMIVGCIGLACLNWYGQYKYHQELYNAAQKINGTAE